MYSEQEKHKQLCHRTAVALDLTCIIIDWFLSLYCSAFFFFSIISTFCPRRITQMATKMLIQRKLKKKIDWWKMSSYIHDYSKSVCVLPSFMLYLFCTRRPCTLVFKWVIMCGAVGAVVGGKNWQLCSSLLLIRREECFFFTRFSTVKTKNIQSVMSYHEWWNNIVPTT